MSSPYDILNLQTIENTDLFKKIHHKLRENRWYKPVLDYTEQSLKVNRVYLVSGASFILVLSLLFEFGISLIYGSVGILYPGYKTLWILETDNPRMTKRWLIYWLIHSAVNFCEIFMFFLHWIPAYWIIKCCFLLWCYAPIERNGSDILYKYGIQPAFKRNQAVIDNAINQAVLTAHSIYTDSNIIGESNNHVHQN